MLKNYPLTKLFFAALLGAIVVMVCISANDGKTKVTEKNLTIEASQQGWKKLTSNPVKINGLGELAWQIEFNNNGQKEVGFVWPSVDHPQNPAVWQAGDVVQIVCVHTMQYHDLKAIPVNNYFAVGHRGIDFNGDILETDK